MTEISQFNSRTGKLSCSPAELFRFVTDIRNLKQFVRSDSVKDLNVDRESCSFYISPLGNINLKISEKKPDRKVIYTGSALKSNDFSLSLDIKESNNRTAEVVVTLDAEMNPIMRMMASKPVKKFLETLIDEMEKFRNWNEIGE